MGKFCWSEWGRLLALAAAAYMVWGSFWAFLYRKFFWDMIGGTLGPAGIIPGPNVSLFEQIVVKIPLLQIFNLLIGLATLALEWPLPFIEGTAIHRSMVLRIGMYIIAGFLGILVYQTVDCAVYYVIVAAVYARAMMLGEVIVAPPRKQSSPA